MSNKMFSSFLWKFLERTSTQIINLVIQIILARLISPEKFGELAILIVFVNIANIFVQKGFSSSLIRKKEISDADCNTVFTVGFIVSLVLYVIIYLLAPVIAKVYNSPDLGSNLRVISIQLFFSAVYCVQNAILVREMKFRTIFFRGFIATVMAGLTGIGLAYKNYGLPALVAQSLLNQILLCVTAWFAVKWRPRFCFYKKNFAEIFSFGSKILLSEILSYFVESLRTLVIGKKYSETDLSYYDRGQTYPATLMRGVYDTLAGVLLPHFSKEQDENESLSQDLLNSVSVSMFIITPVFIGMAAVGPVLIPLLLTEVWIEAIPYFMIFCVYQIPFPIQGILRQAIYAKGQGTYVLKIEIIKSIISLVALLVALPFGVMPIAISAVAAMYITTGVSYFYTKRLITLSVKQIFSGTWKTFSSCIIMFVVVYAMNGIVLNKVVLLLCQVFVGILMYLLLSLMMHNEILFGFLNKVFADKKIKLKN